MYALRAALISVLVVGLCPGLAGANQSDVPLPLEVSEALFASGCSACFGVTLCASGALPMAVLTPLVCHSAFSACVAGHVLFLPC